MMLVFYVLVCVYEVHVWIAGNEIGPPCVSMCERMFVRVSHTVR